MTVVVRGEVAVKVDVRVVAVDFTGDVDDTVRVVVVLAAVVDARGRGLGAAVADDVVVADGREIGALC